MIYLNGIVYLSHFILYLLSNLQLTELLLLRDEFRDIWEWLWLCECDGLESVDRTEDGWSGPANGLGVTVTIGCTEPEIFYYVLHSKVQVRANKITFFVLNNFHNHVKKTVLLNQF